MKTLLEVADQEIEALECAMRSESDMSDYLCDFQKYTSKDLHRVLKRLVDRVKTLESTPERRVEYGVHRTNRGQTQYQLHG